VSAAFFAVAWHAAIAACTWYGPGFPMRSAVSSSVVPASIAAAFHRPRSWSSSVTSSPDSDTRAGVRASCSSINASNPMASGSSGSCDTSTRPSRIASADRVRRTRFEPSEAA
jgi:hypothetical protein